VSGTTRIAGAVELIDAAIADDPNLIRVRGEDRPKELAHAELATEWVRRLRPDAGDALLLAARAHHLRRWAVPRSDYPDGRSGYLRWKTDLQRRHAEEVAPLLAEAGYGPDEVDRVQEIIRKRRLATDPDVQALEDALCLVFLETQFDDLAARLDDETMIEVLRKSLVKMSDEGKRLALTLDFSANAGRLLGAALAE